MADENSAGQGGASKQGERGQTDRAEQALEEFGRRIGRFLASAGARAREEAEDIWAEAQSLRRGERH
jgi:hypothetical protein